LARLVSERYPRRVLSADVSPTDAPSSLGRYKILGELAAGGMATVHLGTLTGRGGFARPVAIKRLHPFLARDPEFVGMFLDEARLAARVAHPNVVPMLDVLTTAANEVLLVMEFVRGISLAQLLRDLAKEGARVPLPIAMGIMIGMLNGLQAAHDATGDAGAPLDIVHRDVSPQNVLIDHDGVPRVLDFGVAKAAGRLHTTRDGRIKGKLAYMAPEQVNSQPVTRRADVYAAAIVMWELVTGKRLFQGQCEADLLRLVLCPQVTPPSSEVPELPKAVDAIVLRGLAVEPEKRFASAREMADAIEATVGSANTTQIRDWVRKAAASALRETDELVAQLTRSAATTPESAVPQIEPLPSIFDPTVSASVVVPEPPRHSRRRAIVSALAATAGFAVAAMVGLQLRAHDAPVPAQSTPSPLALSASPPPSTPDAPPLEASPPTASTSAAVPSARQATSRPASRTTAPRSASGRSCAPYAIDAQGHKVFNAACL
jgi:eukaryotic-like serine/threonine-protein kinase